VNANKRRVLLDILRQIVDGDEDPLLEVGDALAVRSSPCRWNEIPVHMGGDGHLVLTRSIQDGHLDHHNRHHADLRPGYATDIVCGRSKADIVKVWGEDK